MTQVLRFEDIEVGGRHDRLSYLLTPDDVRKYLDTVQDNNPIYLEESSSALPVAPSTICARDVFKLPLMQAFWDGIEICEPPEDRRAFLHARHEAENVNPPRSGMKINGKAISLTNMSKEADTGLRWRRLPGLGVD